MVSSRHKPEPSIWNRSRIYPWVSYATVLSSERILYSHDVAKERFTSNINS